MKEFKERVKDLLNAIDDISTLQMCPSIFSDNFIEHDCDSCPASIGNSGDLYDPDVCKSCWEKAIENSHPKAAGIPRTIHHDAGAIARCSYCGRYSDNPKALQDLKCACGKTHGWSGSFKPPTSESVWT